jgi:hypothetical protein
LWATRGTLALAAPFIAVQAVHSIEQQPWATLFHSPLDGLDQFDAAWVWMRDDTVARNLKASGIPSVIHADPFPSSGHAASHLLASTGLEEPELPDLWRPGGTRVLLHPGSGSPRKVWPRFAELAAMLDDAAIVLGPCEAGFESRHPVLQNLPLPVLAEHFRDCRFFVGNDSGITHIAAYWGAPAAALFGPTDPRVWGPVGKRVQILCRPSLAEISLGDVRKLL